MAHSGTLAARAKAAGMSVAKFAQANVHASGPVGKLARLYYVQQGVHGVGESNMSGAGDKREPGAKLYQIG